MSRRPVIASEPILIGEGFLPGPSQRGKRGHTVGMVDADTIAKVRGLLAIDARMSKRNAVKQVLPTDDVYFEAKYQTIVRALRSA